MLPLELLMQLLLRSPVVRLLGVQCALVVGVLSCDIPHILVG